MEKNTLRRMFNTTFNGLAKLLPVNQEKMISEATAFSVYFKKEFNNIPRRYNGKNYEEYYGKINSVQEKLTEITQRISDLLRELGILSTILPKVFDGKLTFLEIRYNSN